MNNNYDTYLHHRVRHPDEFPVITTQGRSSKYVLLPKRVKVLKRAFEEIEARSKEIPFLFVFWKNSKNGAMCIEIIPHDLPEFRVFE